MVLSDTPSISIAQLDAGSANRRAPVHAAAFIHDPLQFHQLADLSADFINLAAAEIDGAITNALSNIVELLGVDRSQLVRFLPGPGDADVTHSWAVQGVRSIAPTGLAQSYLWAIRHVQATSPPK